MSHDRSLRTCLVVLTSRSSSIAPHERSDDRRVSEAPTASSVYSQSSPETTHDWPARQPAQPSQLRYDDVSPPGSPGLSSIQHGSHQDHDVSPVDNERSTNGLGASQNSATSRIPVPRKSSIPLRNTPSPLHSTASSSSQRPTTQWPRPTSRKMSPKIDTTRWDEYSGEPTDMPTGKPASVRPGEFDYRSTLKSTTGFSDRAARSGSKGLSIQTQARPKQPWDVASGRHAFVAPVADRPEARVKPLLGNPQSPKSPKRRPSADLPRSPASPKITPRTRRPSTNMPDRKSLDKSKALASASATKPQPPETAAVSSVDDQPDNEEDPIKPTPPLKVGRTSPPRSVASPVSQTYTMHPYPSPVTPGSNAHQPSEQTSTGNQSQHSRPSVDSDARTPSSPPARPSIDTSLESQPANLQKDQSRFSWTTVATNTTYQHSPPPSPPPPMPAAVAAPRAQVPTPAPFLPPNATVVSPVGSAAATPRSAPLRSPSPEQVETPTSHKLDDTYSSSPITEASTPTPLGPMLNRRRPISSAASSIYTIQSTISTARKPVPSTATITGSVKRAPLGSTSVSNSRSSKALPLSPPELASGDLISSLEAQRADLQLRRKNVQRLIRDHTAEQMQNPLVKDIKARREDQKKVKEWEDEMAEIVRWEHETGLRLHRALKRKDVEEGREGSALWVRRVTD